MATTTSTLVFPRRALLCRRCLLDSSSNSSSSLDSSVDSWAKKRRNFPALFICDVGDDEMIIVVYLWVFAIMFRHFTSKLLMLAFSNADSKFCRLVVFLRCWWVFCLYVFLLCLEFECGGYIVFERLLSLSGDDASAYVLANIHARFE